MRVSLVFLAVLGFAAASPLIGQVPTVLASSDKAARNDLIEQVVVALVEGLRSAIVNGNDLTPVLDPYEKDYYYFDEVALDQPGAHLEVTNVYATGLSSFVLEEINVELTSALLQWYRADLKITIATLAATVENYDIYATIWNSLIWGNGEASLTITNLVLEGYLNLSVFLDGGLYLSVRNCRISLAVDEFKPTFTGVLGNEASSTWASQWMEDFVLSLLNNYKDLVTLYLSGVITDAGNRVLEGLDVAQMLMEAARV